MSQKNLISLGWGHFIKSLTLWLDLLFLKPCWTLSAAAPLMGVDFYSEFFGDMKLFYQTGSANYDVYTEL